MAELSKNTKTVTVDVFSLELTTEERDALINFMRGQALGSTLSGVFAALESEPASLVMDAKIRLIRGVGRHGPGDELTLRSVTPDEDEEYMAHDAAGRDVWLKAYQRGTHWEVA